MSFRTLLIAILFQPQTIMTQIPTRGLVGSQPSLTKRSKILTSLKIDPLIARVQTKTIHRSKKLICKLT